MKLTDPFGSFKVDNASYTIAYMVSITVTMSKPNRLLHDTPNHDKQKRTIQVRLYIYLPHGLKNDSPVAIKIAI